VRTARSRTKITDAGPFSKYFHYMLNMADDDLDLFEYRLLGHYRRECGGYNEPCEETIRDTARKIKGMSAAKVSETRRALAAKGWIKIEMEKGHVSITLEDRMKENIDRYANTDGPENARSPRDQRDQEVINVITTRSVRSPRDQRDQEVINPDNIDRARESTEQNQQEQNQQDQNQPPTTPLESSQPPVVGDVGDGESLILPEIRKLMLSPTAQRELLAHGPAYALALAWECTARGVTNPGGLAVTKMHNGGPADAMLELAALALDLAAESGVLDREAADRVLKRRELDELREQAQEHVAAAQESDEPLVVAAMSEAAESTATPELNGLDGKPDPTGFVTWADVWMTAKGTLAAQLNGATYQGYLAKATAATYADGVLTICAPNFMAMEMLRLQYRAAVEEAVSKAAGVAIAVAFTTSQTIVRRLEDDPVAAALVAKSCI